MSNRRKAFNFQKDESEEFPLEINGEEVTCVPSIDGLKLLEFTAVMRSPEFGTGERAAAILNLLRQAIGGLDDEGNLTRHEEWRKFERIAKENALAIEELGQVAGYLASVYSERPTESASPSSAGQTTTGSSSEESSPSEA